MSSDETIAKALCLLEGAHDGSAEPPAMVILPPDSNAFIIGNQRGFIRLAVAALRASQGQEQPFKKESWIVEDNLDWCVKGLKYDESAHIYLPEKKTRAEKMRGSILGILTILVLCSSLLVGIITIGKWLGHWFIRLAP